MKHYSNLYISACNGIHFLKILLQHFQQFDEKIYRDVAKNIYNFKIWILVFLLNASPFANPNKNAPPRINKVG